MGTTYGGIDSRAQKMGCRGGTCDLKGRMAILRWQRNTDATSCRCPTTKLEKSNASEIHRHGDKIIQLIGMIFICFGRYGVDRSVISANA